MWEDTVCNLVRGHLAWLVSDTPTVQRAATGLVLVAVQHYYVNLENEEEILRVRQEKKI